MRETIAMFGAERAMVGSNFPVDSLCSGFDEILGGFKSILETLPRSGQEAFFAATARRVYRLAPVAAAPAGTA